MIQIANIEVFGLLVGDGEYHKHACRIVYHIFLYIAICKAGYFKGVRFKCEMLGSPKESTVIVGTAANVLSYNGTQS